MVLFLGYTPQYCLLLAASEITTPIVCLFSIADFEKKEWKLYPAAATALLFPFRTWWFGYLVWIAVVEKTDLVVGLNAEFVGFLCLLVLFALNLKWMYKVACGVVQVITGKHQDEGEAKSQ